MKVFISFLMLVVVFFHANMNVSNSTYDEDAYQRLSFVLEDAAHAAAMQVTPPSVSDGFITFDQSQADQMFRTVLASNLKLDPNNLSPLAGSIYKSGATLQLEQFIDYSNATFPDHYVNAQLGIDVVLNGPSIIYAVQIPVPQLYKSSPAFLMKWNTAEAYPDAST